METEEFSRNFLQLIHFDLRTEIKLGDDGVEGKQEQKTLKISDHQKIFQETLT